jgi:hypothetical protein
MTQIPMKKLEAMPEFLTGNDLVSLGLYKSNNALYIARLRGQSPDYIQVVRRVLYPRESVIAFLDAHSMLGSMVKSDNTNIK